MNLREEILREHSKKQCDKIVAWVGADQQRFDELFRLFSSGEYRVVQRSGWPMAYCVEKHPAFMKKHFATLLKNVKRTDLHVAVKRNTLRLLQDIDIPVKFRGEIMNLCFEWLQTSAETIAVKAFSLSVLKNLANDHPEIIPEVKLIIEEMLPRETAAFRSRAKQFLKATTTK